MNEALERLAEALPYLMHSVEEAAKVGKPALAVVAIKEDGSGMILSTIEDPGGLFSDIADVAGLPRELTVDERARCEAVAFLHRHGVTSH